MATLHIAWITTQPPAGDDPGAVINDIVASEAVTTSGTSAKSGVRPAGATHAVCSSVDDDHYVTPYGLGKDAGAALQSVHIPTGSFQTLQVAAGEKIAAITV